MMVVMMMMTMVMMMMMMMMMKIVVASHSSQLPANSPECLPETPICAYPLDPLNQIFLSAFSIASVILKY